MNFPSRQKLKYVSNCIDWFEETAKSGSTCPLYLVYIEQSTNRLLHQTYCLIERSSQLPSPSTSRNSKEWNGIRAGLWENKIATKKRQLRSATIGANFATMSVLGSGISEYYGNEHPK